MSHKLYKTFKHIIKYLLWPLGSLLIGYWIYANWAEPSLIGFDKQKIYAQGAAQVWGVRIFYIYSFLFAEYRAYAELGDRYDLPYELLPSLIAYLVPLLLVLAMLEFQWFA